MVIYVCDQSSWCRMDWMEGERLGAEASNSPNSGKEEGRTGS